MKDIVVHLTLEFTLSPDFVMIDFPSRTGNARLQQCYMLCNKGPLSDLDVLR